MDQISQKVLNLKDELIKTRRFFHSQPENGFYTFFTTAKIAKIMENLGYEVKMGKDIMKADARQGLGTKEECQEAIKRAKTLLDEDEQKYLPIMEDGLTGLVATIDTKKPGKNVAFRFDIDCVNVTESSDESHRPFKEGFASNRPGFTHACGHDSHISMGLALAKLIKENINDFNGKFTFIFQTAEEGTRGAVAMEAAGICKGIDYLLGGHMGFQADQDKGIICGTNKLLATNKFDVFLKGKSAHAGGAPQDGRNALLAGAQMALSMHGITRHAKGVTRINVGKLTAGEGRNVIAPNAHLLCETRGETTDLNNFMYDRCMEIVKGVSQIYGVEYDILRTGGTSGGDSDKEVSEIYYEASLQSPFIDDDKIIKESNFGACEDFAHFMYAVQQQGGKAAYLMIGTNLKACHHNEKFDINEDSMLAGVDVFLRSAYKLNGIK